MKATTAEDRLVTEEQEEQLPTTMSQATSEMTVNNKAAIENPSEPKTVAKESQERTVTVTMIDALNLNTSLLLQEVYFNIQIDESSLIIL